MLQRRPRERSLFEVLLPDGHNLWLDWLHKIDTPRYGEPWLRSSRRPSKSAGRRAGVADGHGRQPRS
jgi:hypothetical protein